jgi:hypothetical protein
MARKPQPPPRLMSWDVYKIAKNAVWLGIVEAPDKKAAVEKAAQEFKTGYGVCTRCGSDDPGRGP